MTDLLKIQNGPTPTPPATVEMSNYKNRFCGVVSSGDSKNILVKNTLSKISKTYHRRTKKNSSSVTKLNLVEKW